MDVKEAISARKSIRAFRPDPIPKQILKNIMESALRAPSWGNTQPWGFTIVGGSILEQIKKETVSLFQKDAPSAPDIPMPESFNKKQTARRKDLGKTLFHALGIEREDKEKRHEHYIYMTRCFGAPYVIYLHLEKGFNSYALLDSGIILQTIALLAINEGLGTCFLARSVRYPDVVRKYAKIASDQRIVMGMGIGYPAANHPVNLYSSPRGKPDEFLRWVDIDLSHSA